MSNYEAGTFPGFVQDYGISETRAGDPQVYISFEVHFPTKGKQPMTWYGNLKSDKSQEITFRALQAVGFKGSKIMDLLDGRDSDTISIGAEASLVVEEEPRQDGQGTFFKVRWVNRVGGGGGQVQRADANKAKAKLLALGVDGAWMKHRQLNPTPAPKDAPAGGNDDDIPF